MKYQQSNREFGLEETIPHILAFYMVPPSSISRSMVEPRWADLNLQPPNMSGAPHGRTDAAEGQHDEDGGLVVTSGCIGGFAIATGRKNGAAKKTEEKW